jgi:hypothetical protein
MIEIEYHGKIGFTGGEVPLSVASVSVHEAFSNGDGVEDSQEDAEREVDGTVWGETLVLGKGRYGGRQW